MHSKNSPISLPQPSTIIQIDTQCCSCLFIFPLCFRQVPTLHTYVNRYVYRYVYIRVLCPIFPTYTFFAFKKLFISSWLLTLFCIHFGCAARGLDSHVLYKLFDPNFQCLPGTVRSHRPCVCFDAMTQRKGVETRGHVRSVPDRMKGV